jgi:L-fuconolactonase
MSPLAECDNVHCKLSGMVTEAQWTSWTPADLAPYIDRTLDWFGPKRCMFGSDWPVCLLAADYRQVVNALKLALEDLDPSEQHAVLGENAVRLYRLER